MFIFKTQIVSNGMKKIYYFDYASTTPVDKRVLSKMKPFFSDDFGNPSNLYSLGRNAKRALELYKNKIIRVIECKPEEFVFTASATEADNLAIFGVAYANKHLGNKIIISNVEHKAVEAACNALAKENYIIQKLKIGKDGLLNPRELSKALDSKTILVSITYADGETGTIQPIKQIARVISKFKNKSKSAIPYFHVDASQAANFLDINVYSLGVNLLTLSSQKIYGPKGVGGLYIRKGTLIQPIIYGGGQQNNIRSGTENVPAIVGFGEALEIAHKIKKQEYARIRKLRDKLEAGILKKIKKVIINGNLKNRLPNFLNVSILDIEGEAMLLHLDNKGIFVNTGSACNSETLEPSEILLAFGRSYEHIHGSLRFTLGRYTSEKDVKYVIKYLPPIIERLRKISPLNLKINHKKIMSLPKAFIGEQTPHFLRKNDTRIKKN